MIIKELQSKYFIYQLDYVGEGRFAFGANLAYEKLNKKEFYILFLLGFWKLSLGIKV